MSARLWLVLFSLSLGFGGAALAEPEDAQKIPSSLTMHSGEVLKFKNVNMAATSDHKVIALSVMNKILTIRAKQGGYAMMFVFPPNAAGPQAIKSGAKKRITVHVLP